MLGHEQTIPNLLTLAPLNFVTGKIALNVADRPGLVRSPIRLLTDWPRLTPRDNSPVNLVKIKYI